MQEQWEFEHAKFPAGTPVYVVPAIVNIHSLSPVAGKHGITGKGIAYAVLVPFEDQEAKVPVIVNERMWYVEQEYVMRDGRQEAREEKQ